jgi:hypothetical protein
VGFAIELDGREVVFASDTAVIATSFEKSIKLFIVGLVIQHDGEHVVLHGL